MEANLDLKTVASLVATERERLVKNGMLRPAAHLTACHVVGASLYPPTGGAELNDWLTAKMRMEKERREMAEKEVREATNGAPVKIVVEDVEFPGPRRPVEKKHVLYEELAEHLKGLEPGKARRLTSESKETLQRQQEALKHIGKRLGWPQVPEAYRSTLRKDGKLFHLYVERMK